jgi:hypothetical protein
MIDSNLKAWVIEVNNHPSMNIYLCQEGPKGLIKEISEIDKFIKMKVAGDAMKLMKNKKKSQRHEVDEYRSYTRILPCEDDD